MAAPGTPFEERDLTGAVAVVTGATRGIGALLAAELVKRGAKVVSLARGAPDAPVAGVDYRVCDLAKASAIAAAVEGIAASYGHIDILVHNAAVMPGIFAEPTTVPDALEEACIDINVAAPIALTKRALPLLLKSPRPELRTVIFVSSSAGYLTEPEEGNGMLAYRASKAALGGLCVGLRELYCTDNATAVRTRGGADKTLGRVVAVHPGFVQTGLGLETAGPDFAGKSPAEYAAVKAGWGAISVADGTDTLLWLCAARDIPHNGKLYYQRAVHSW